jgi:Bacterial CdiA-CT RNAse A domain
VRPDHAAHASLPPGWLAGLLALLLQLACQAAPPPSPPPQVSAAPATAPQERQAPPAAADATAKAAARYDLGRDESRGGHTLARHVGKSDAQLKERLRKERGISAASTYADRPTAERVVAQALARERGRVDQWLSRQGPRPNLALDYHGDARDIIGRSLARGSGQPVRCTDAVVVLRWDGGRGFIVLTSYPEVSK